VLTDQDTLETIASDAESDDDDVESDSEDELRDSLLPTIDPKHIKLDLAKGWDHIKDLHQEMTKEVVELYDHCKKHGREPKDAAITVRAGIRKKIEDINTTIRSKNVENGLYSDLGVVNASVLETWYVSDQPGAKAAAESAAGSATKPEVVESADKLGAGQQGSGTQLKTITLRDKLYEDYVMWITHQFPISFLRNRANCGPSYRGRYPSMDNLGWYYRAQHGIDPYSKKALTDDEQAREKGRFQSQKFFRSIYPKVNTRPPIPPSRAAMVKQEPLEEAPKVPTVRRHLNLVSYGVSTEQFEPGYTFFGKKIIAVDKRPVREGRNTNSRLYLVKMAEGLIHIYNESEVGGERIFTVCQNMPDILDIVRHKSDFVGEGKMLSDKSHFQAHGWGIKYVALKSFINSPAHAQPMTMVVVHYRKEAQGELMEIGMSKACLASLVGDTTARTFISRALAGPKGDVHTTIWPHLPVGIQRKVWSRAAVVDARLGKVIEPTPSPEEIERVTKHLERTKLQNEAVQEAVNNGEAH